MAEKSSSSSRGWLWSIGAIAALIAVFFIVRSFTQSAVNVRVAKVEFQDITTPVPTNGKVEPLDDFQAHAPLPGVVQRLLVSVGDKVRKGQELIRLDTSDVKSKIVAAEAALQANQSSLHNVEKGGTQEELLAQAADMTAAQNQEHQAEESLASLQSLQSKGAASANEVATAQQRVMDAKARIAQLQAKRTKRYSAEDLATQHMQVAQAYSNLQAARSAYADVDIHAPFAGTVYSIPVNQYDYVNSGEALLNVADLNHVEILAYFDEPEIGKLADGQPVKIVWDAKPNQTWHGHITQAPTTVINYGTRNVGECHITVDDAKGDLLPNTNVTVTVTTLFRPHVLSMPREALHTEGTTNYVYKIVGGHLSRTNVSVGVVNLTRVEITGGVSDGDTVVLGATSEADLTNGLQVKAQH